MSVLWRGADGIGCGGKTAEDAGGINRTYVSVELFHPFRHVDEQAFRYSERLSMADTDRSSYLVREIVGKRLTRKGLNGKTWVPRTLYSASRRRISSRGDGEHFANEFTDPR